MKVLYEGRRNPADRTCIIMRVDLTRLASALRLNSPIDRKQMLVEVPFSRLYSTACAFEWGNQSVEAWDLAWHLLHDAMPDHQLNADAVERYMVQVVSKLPDAEWSLEWAEVVRWYVQDQAPDEAAALVALDGWKGVL